MKDKERVLMYLVQRIYMKALYSPEDFRKWRDTQPPFFGSERKLEKGDLVVAFTTPTPNDFLVGYVEEVKEDCVVIREIGSKRLCDYSNERFMRIDKELLGYEILEGVQYLTYNKAKKACANAIHSYSYRFCGISFADNVCCVELRKVFSNEKVFKIEFKYNSKTTIKSITELIDKATENYIVQNS